MNLPHRHPQTCPFRSSAEKGAETGTAVCRLLLELSGARDAALCRVRQDACEACCRSFLPSAENMNPVIASLAYQMASRVAEQGGVPGCDARRAADLLSLAVQNLPSEEDCQDDSIGLAPRAGEAPADRLRRLIPPPERRSGPQPRQWAVGVTTAPRAVATLSDCLESLHQAGWENPRLFVDGDVAIPAAFARLPQSHREPRLGAWPNYFLALTELYLRQPDAEAYLLAQDDALLAEGTREYLEQVLWPEKGPAIASLFCSRAYVQPQAGWHRFRGTWVWCALAFVFSPEAARRFLADLDVVQHRLSRRRKPLADIDWRIGRWALQHGVPLYYPTPSLVQHIGDVSSLWPGVRLFGNRRASQFAGSPLRPS